MAPTPADVWSLHPLALVETAFPSFFGSRVAEPTIGTFPWMFALNGGHESFFLSLYHGPAVLALGAVGAVVGRRRGWALFWVCTAVVAIVLAAGSFTPVYPWLRSWLPIVRAFRYPVKYIVFASLATAALVAAAWDARAVENRRQINPARWRAARVVGCAVPAALAALAYALSAGSQYLRTPTAEFYRWAAGAVRAADPTAATLYLLLEAPGAANRVLVLSCAAAFLMWVSMSARREATRAAGVLYLFVVADLVVQSIGLCPTFDAALFQVPSWVSPVAAAPQARLYFGGKAPGRYELKDADAGRQWRVPDESSSSARGDIKMAQLAWYPSAWRVREAFSEDLPAIQPASHLAAQHRFLSGTRLERDRFLDRTGVRFRVLPDRVAGGRAPIARVRYSEDLGLYDWGASVSRVAVREEAEVMPGVQPQFERLLSESFDATDVVLLDHALVPAGRAGAPKPASAAFISDDPSCVVLEASVGAPGGYLVLFDSFSPEWRATVDGEPAEIGRADGLFRAVHLKSGSHTVEFRYHPSAAFLAGASVSGTTALLMALLAFGRLRPASFAVGSRG